MRNDVIDIESLLVFATVVREKSFSQAADTLKRSKQSVHRQIKAFEEDLSVKLFRKVNRGIIPTAIGLELFEVAERILGEASTAAYLVKRKDSESRLQIRITAPPLFAEGFLSASIAQIAAAHPGLQIDCLLSNDLVHLTEHNIDIAFRIGRLGHEVSAEFATTQLGSVKRIIVASPSYLNKFGIPQSVGDLRKHSILFFGRLNDYHLASWPLKSKFEFKPRLSASSPYLILDATLKGAGISMLPEMICAEHLKKGKLQAILDELSVSSIPVTMIYRNSLRGVKLLEKFLERITAEAQSTDWLNQS